MAKRLFFVFRTNLHDLMYHPLRKSSLPAFLYPVLYPTYIVAGSHLKTERFSLTCAPPSTHKSNLILSLRVSDIYFFLTRFIHFYFTYQLQLTGVLPRPVCDYCYCIFITHCYILLSFFLLLIPIPLQTHLITLSNPSSTNTL